MRKALARAFELGDSELAELVALAEAEQDAAVCLHGFTRTINDSLDLEQKARIVELLWSVAYADGDLDRYEEHVIRKVSELLYVPHADYIAAKLRAEQHAQPDT